jgi:alpha-L-rhamnosidase
VLAAVPKSAVIYVTGVGMESTTINGKPIGDAVLEPAVTDYNTEMQYRTYDVASLLHAGLNTLEIATGSGMYLQTPAVRNSGASNGRYSCPFCRNNGETGPPRVIAQLDMTDSNGTKQTIATGPDWLSALSPTTFSSWYGGEDYNAQIAQTLGAVPPSANNTMWTPAANSALSSTTTPRSTTQLVANPRPPVVLQQVLEPVKITEVSPATYVLDYGKNFSGWPALNLTDPAPGQNIKILPAEELNSDGTVKQNSMGVTNPANGVIRYDYVPSSEANQTWHPSFTYSGFRYLQVTGLPSAPTESTVTAWELYAANQSAGTFSSSNTLLNQINTLVHNAVDGNMESVVTDCPDREKGPYNGDVEQDILNLLNDYDMRAYMRAEVRNFAESQRANGSIPPTGPAWIGGDDGTNWAGAIITVPWALYQNYGDTVTLRTYYSNMQRYLAFIASRTTNYLLPSTYGPGDWVTSDPTSTPTDYLNDYGYYIQVGEMAQIATLIGANSDAEMYRALATNIGAVFNAKFFNVAAHTYATGSQAADALALDAGLVPPSEKNAVASHLLATIAANNGLIAVGSVSLAPMLQALHATGNDDVVYKWAESTAFPSYGYVLSLGNTTMTET